MLKLRVLPMVLATTLCGSVLLIAGPAAAVPGTPTIGTLDSTTAGEVSGSVTSDAPFVFVAVVAGPTDTNPTRTLVTMASSSAFALATWGYGNQASVAAWACPTSTFGEADCSARSTSAFTPTDVAPQITWFADSTLGPDDPDPVITASDPSGNGILRLSQLTGGSTLATTSLPPGTPTTLAVQDRIYSEIVVSRCSADLLHCRTLGFRYLSVARAVQVTGPAVISPATTVQDLSFVLDTTMDYVVTESGEWRYATADVSWHLESVADPGTPVGGTRTAHFDVNGFGATGPLTMSATEVPDGEYVAVGTVDVAHPDFGTYPDVPFTTVPFVVDTEAPVLEIVANRTTIYPRINTPVRPARVTWTVTGATTSDIGTAYVVSPGGNYVKELTLTPTATGFTTYWTGTNRLGSRVASGYYKLLFRDPVDNLVSAYGVVKVDARDLVVKVWKKTVTASGSLVDKYIGNCSTLRRPAGRGWSSSLGFYANTKCGTRTTKASLVSTIHATKVLSAPDGYESVKVATYGGAATTRPGSYAFLRYLSTAGAWNTEEVMKPQLGLHYGRQRGASGMIYGDRTFEWGLYTGFGHRYDVKTFTVIVRYRTLG